MTELANQIALHTSPCSEACALSYDARMRCPNGCASITTRRCRTHVVPANEIESMQRFIATNGGAYIGHARENESDVAIVWFEDSNSPVDVSEFPTWRMI